MTPAPRSPLYRNLRLALVLALVAAAFYVGFFYAVAHRGT